MANSLLAVSLTFVITAELLCSPCSIALKGKERGVRALRLITLKSHAGLFRVGGTDGCGLQCAYLVTNKPDGG